MEYKRFQVQVETSTKTFLFEVGANEIHPPLEWVFSALKLKGIEESEVHIGGYSEIGTSSTLGILDYTEKTY